MAAAVCKCRCAGMSPIKELKWIINNQKSVTTAKLGRLILQFEKVLIKKDKQIRKMTRALNELNHEKQLIERLALIDDDRQIFLAKEYHEELKKAARNKEVSTLQKLIEIKTLNELKDFLDRT